MSTIIDADAAKLAGLQIDLLKKMRQGHVTLAQLEWFTGLSKEARDNLFWSCRPSILEFVSMIVLPGTTCKFVAREEFIRDRRDNAKASISYLSSNFVEWFLAGTGKIEDPMAEQVLRYAKLRQSSVDGPIIAALGGEANAEISLTALFSLMKKQGHGQPGVLLNNGYGNIFYPRDSTGVLRSVGVFWYDDGWYVYARSLEYSYRWHDGYHVFSRNSVLVSSETLAPA